MIALFVQPEDVWLFRDGRPMDSAGSRPARSLFPPSPTIVQGALRSQELARKKVNLSDKAAIQKTVGAPDSFGDLRLKAPLVAAYDGTRLTRYFPRPADWFPTATDSEEIQALSPRQPGRNIAVSAADSDFPQLLFPRDFPAGKKTYGEWLDEHALQAYLKGDAVVPISAHELFGWDSRLGIKLNAKKRAVEEGMLYQVEPVFLKTGIGLYLEFEGFEGWEQNGLFRLGGENRAARYEQIANPPGWFPCPEPLPKKFKIYFASPACFENGWRPSNWNLFFDGEVKLQAAALGGYYTIGGYDYVRHQDKDSNRYVPAGSVYFFECVGEARLNPNLIQNAVTQYGAEIGFGQVIFTSWK